MDLPTQEPKIVTDRHVTRYVLPFAKNRRFVGRTSTLDALAVKFFKHSDCPRPCLVGLGGISKTQVALKFAYWIQEHQPDLSVFWVSALSKSSFEQSYTKIATDVRILENQKGNANDGSHTDVKVLVRDYLDSLETGPWFLILDNGDDTDLVLGTPDNPGGLEKYLPNRPDGRILFTARSREIATAVSECDFIELEQMNGEEARSVLEKSVQRKELLHDTAIEELLRELNCLPLAIVQAAAYFNRNRMSVSRYLELLGGTEQGTVSLMSREFRDRTRYDETQHPVATTWLVSFDQILQHDETAAHLLRFISCIEPKSIPRSLLPGQGSEEALDFSISTLCSYAFLTPCDGYDIFDMHSLVHLATVIWVRRHGSSDAARWDSVKHLRRIFPHADRGNRPEWRLFLPHGLKLLQERKIRGSVDRSLVLVCVGYWHSKDYRFREAIECWQESIDWFKNNLPEGDTHTLYAEEQLAHSYYRACQMGKPLSCSSMLWQRKGRSC